MKIAGFVALVGVLITSPVLAAGFAHNANFVVFTPSQPTKEAGQKLAEEVLQQADRFRDEIAREWLGEALAARSGRTVINVELTDEEDRGLTWAKDHPGRTLHNIYLTTSAENAVGCTLRHEIAHVVLATRYPHPHRLPTWLEEGIASRYDDETTMAARQRTVRVWGRFARFPRLASLVAMRQIPADDETSYAAAASLVSFLLTRGDWQTLLEFGAAGEIVGWDSAVRTHYGIASVGQLQAEWESWLRSSDATAPRVPQQIRLGELRRARHDLPKSRG